MGQHRYDIEHDIWLTAYLTALRTCGPDDAERLATAAVRHYAERWLAKPPATVGEKGIGERPFGVRGYLFSEMNLPDQQ